MIVMHEWLSSYGVDIFDNVLKKKKRIQLNMEKVDWGLFTFIWESKGKSGASKN